MTAPAMPSLSEPVIVKLAVWITFLNTWVLFQEIAVDRQGLWRYMPHYRVGKFCRGILAQWHSLGSSYGDVSETGKPPGMSDQ